MKFVPAYGQLGDIEKAREYWTKCVEIEPDWSAQRMLDILHNWNFTEADTVKVMEGVYKAGIARP